MNSNSTGDLEHLDYASLGKEKPKEEELPKSLKTKDKKLQSDIKNAHFVKRMQQRARQNFAKAQDLKPGYIIV